MATLLKAVEEKLGSLFIDSVMCADHITLIDGI